MSLIITIAAIIMVLVALIYLYAGAKEKHLGLFIGGMAWVVGSYSVYQLENLWPLPVAYLVALFLNKNPKH